jgi:hypothetical protein
MKNRIFYWGIQNSGMTGTETDPFHPHSNHFKLALKEHQQQARICFALAMRDDADQSVFNNMMDVVHIDEKWFHINKKMINVWF